MIHAIAITDLTRLYKSSIFWFMLAMSQLIFSFFINNGAVLYSVSQSQFLGTGGPLPGVTSNVAIPAMLIISIIAVIIVPIMSMRMIADEKRSHTFQLLASSPISSLSIALGKYLGIIYFLLIILTLQFLATILYLGTAASLNYLQLIVCYMSLVLLLSMYTSIGLFCSSIFKSPLVAAIFSFTIILTFWFLEINGNVAEPDTIFSQIKSWLYIGNHFSDFPEGLVSLNSVLYFLFLSAYFIALTVIRLEEQRTNPNYNSMISYVLATGLLIVMALIVPKIELQVDTTNNQHKSLHENTINTIESFDQTDQEVTFKLFIDEQNAEQFNTTLLKQFTSASNKFTTKVVSIEKNPDLARQFQISSGLELIIQTKAGKQEKIIGQRINEQNITSRLQKMLRTQENYTFFITDHGERSIYDNEDRNSYSLFFNNLASLGVTLSPLSILTTETIPDNTNMIIVADPQSNYQRSEIAVLQKYIEDGGNAIFLFSLPPQSRLKQFLDSEFGVTLSSKPIASNTDGYLPARYENTQILTYNPLAITTKEKNNWKAIPLANTYENNGLVAVKLLRNKQKVAVFSDANIFSNAHIGELSNFNLGLKIVNEFNGEEILARLDRPTPADATLDEDNFWTAKTILLYLISLFLLLAWGVLWYLRSRKR